jgi:hypothetical protein
VAAALRSGALRFAACSQPPRWRPASCILHDEVIHTARDDGQSE